MAVTHIVWDWNGTLLNDLPNVLDAVSRSIDRYGLHPVDGDTYRNHFTRPVRNFYDSLFGRTVTDMEWLELNKSFHDYYYEVVDGIELAVGARSALERVDQLGWTQSLLSMSDHTHLLATVRAHGIAHHFKRIDGMVEPDGSLKAIYLKQHLEAIDVDPSAAFIIGDTPDDHDAAVSLGAGVVLYDSGSHHRPVLDALGVPVVSALTDAVAAVERAVE
jgi:phosphoglycolate phosphatase-like HAD superfamily hydrolase